MKPQMLKRDLLKQLIPVAIVITVAAVLSVGPAGAARSSYSPTLGVSWPLGAATTANSSGTFYEVSGCGYNASLGGVTVSVTSPYAVSSAGQMPDSNGCISLSNFDTLGSGHYVVNAYQTMKRKLTLVASTSFDVP
jgi:hypothetical protein